jgi:flagellar protein FlaI
MSIGEVAGVENDSVIINPVFEWDPTGDAITMTPEGSAVIRKIQDDRGWSDRRMIGEIADRTAVLRWLAGHMITDGGEVCRIVGEFSRDRAALLEKVRSDRATGGRVTDERP